MQQDAATHATDTWPVNIAMTGYRNVPRLITTSVKKMSVDQFTTTQSKELALTSEVSANPIHRK